MKSSSLARKTIVIAVVFGASIAAAYFGDRSSIVFEHQLSECYRLTIRQSSGDDANSITLRLTYHNPPAIGLYEQSEQTVFRPAAELTFTSVTDAETGVICVFDDNDIGFSLLYDPRTEDLWDSTGRSFSWGGRDSTHWQTLLIQLRERHPTIPHRELPGDR